LYFNADILIEVKHWIVIAAAALLPVLYAQDAPRSKASDYLTHVAISGMEIGAEYLVHSIPSEKGDYFAKEYLVVEVAVFPAAKDSLKISNGHFTLRINKKATLTAQSAGTVAAALKYPDWEQRPQMTAQAGPLIYGAPQVGRFPGDPTQTQPMPTPRVPDQTDSANVQKPSDLPIEEAISPRCPAGRAYCGTRQGLPLLPVRREAQIPQVTGFDLRRRPHLA
jgi:hypothetical protein